MNFLRPTLLAWFLLAWLLIVACGSDAEEAAPKIARADLPHIAFQIRVGYTTSSYPSTKAEEDTIRHPPVIGSSFDSLWYLPPEPLRADFSRRLEEGVRARWRAAGFINNVGRVRYGLYSLLERDYQVQETGTGTLLTVLSDQLGFESIPHVIAVWQSDGDSLVFRGLLNHGISVGIGSARLERVVGLPDSSYLLMGSTRGGDGGGGWGSVWFAHWRQPLDLKFLFEKSWDKPDTFENLQVAMDYELDPTTLQAIVAVRQRGHGSARFTEAPHDWKSWVDADSTYSGRTDWTTVDADTVKLAELIAR